MWFLDKYGNSINSEQLLSLYVDSDGSGGYEVKGNNQANTEAAQFAVSPPMTEAQAQALQARMNEILGITDLTE